MIERNLWPTSGEGGEAEDEHGGGSTEWREEEGWSGSGDWRETKREEGGENLTTKPSHKHEVYDLAPKKHLIFFLPLKSLPGIDR